MDAETPIAGKPAGFFVVRTPLLPVNTIDRWLAIAREAGDGEVTRRGLSDALRCIVRDPIVREAIFIASASLNRALEPWLAGGENRKVELAISRYISRMATRPTPFGLFSGWSLETVCESNDETALVVCRPQECERRARLDAGIVHSMWGTMLAVDRDAASVLVIANQTLFQYSDTWHYYLTDVKRVDREEQLASIVNDDILQAVIAYTYVPRTVEACTGYIVHAGDGTIDPDEARRYVWSLIDEQVLVSSVEPPLTGDEPLSGLSKRLAASSTRPKERARLAQIITSVSSLMAPLSVPKIAEYALLEESLQGLTVDTDAPRSVLLNLQKPSRGASLSRADVAQILAAGDLIGTLSPSFNSALLATFKQSFVQRYERRAVPLLEVLDEERGIGFSASAAPDAGTVSLVQGLLFGQEASSAGQWSSRDVALLRLLERAAQTNAQQIVLTDRDVADLASRSPQPLPHSFAVMVTLTGAATPDEPSLLLRSVSGPSGTNLLARFCHDSEELTKRVQAHLVDESDCMPGKRLAEVVYLPSGRLGNVIARPLLRQYEIPILTTSGAAPDHILRLDDLLVTVVDDRVVLRSRSAHIEIEPRLSSAHAHMNSANPIYRFLCALQAQEGPTWRAWSWGVLQSTSFLPRVVYGRVALSRAQWLLRKAEIDELSQSACPHDAALALQREKRMPRWVLWVDGDNELLIDFENALSVETFVSSVKKRSQVVVAELYPLPSTVCGDKDGGLYTHELILPVIRGVPTPATTAAMPPVPPAQPRQAILRVVSPGQDNEWTYLKIYAGPATADRVLLELCGTTLWTAEQPWFFVRYADPEQHLRLRLRGGLATTASRTLIQRVGDIVARGNARSFQIDTYEREIERYGGGVGMRLSEEMFCIDSDVVSRSLRALSESGAMDQRWKICLVRWDQWLSLSSWDLRKIKHFCEDMRTALATQLNADGRTARQLGDRFRAARQALEHALSTKEAGPESLAGALDIVRSDYGRSRGLIERLNESCAKREIDASMESLMGSFLHMTANRMLRSGHRHQEFVLYDYLTRLYEGQLGKARGRGNRTV